jgi:hypothetical protein
VAPFRTSPEFARAKPALEQKTSRPVPASAAQVSGSGQARNRIR